MTAAKCETLIFSVWGLALYCVDGGVLWFSSVLQTNAKAPEIRIWWLVSNTLSRFILIPPTLDTSSI
jgi:hypothetical protein